MGRYDELTQVEEKPSDKILYRKRLPEVRKKRPLKLNRNLIRTLKNLKIMKSRNHEYESPIDTPVKYSTLIRTQFIKKIKIHAAETDLKDYEVIELALTEFFKTHE